MLPIMTVPWSNLITGLVGLGGIGGTILAARMTGRSQLATLRVNIGAEDRRAAIADKRRTYARGWPRPRTRVDDKHGIGHARPAD